MEKAVFTGIKTQLLTYCPNTIKHVGVWNNQVENLLAQENLEYPWDLSACFIELPEDMGINGVGGGVQIAEVYEIKLHYLGFKLTETDGQMEENWDVFDAKKEGYKALQFFHCSGTGPFNRISETPDHDHGSLYHFIQVFQTTWTDLAITLPQGGVDTDPPFFWDADKVEIDN